MKKNLAAVALILFLTPKPVFSGTKEEVLRLQSDVLQLTETFELMVQSIADILSLVGILLVMLVILPALGLADWRLAQICLSFIPILFFFYSP